MSAYKIGPTTDEWEATVADLKDDEIIRALAGTAPPDLPWDDIGSGGAKGHLNPLAVLQLYAMYRELAEAIGTGVPDDEAHAPWVIADATLRLVSERVPA